MAQTTRKILFFGRHGETSPSLILPTELLYVVVHPFYKPEGHDSPDSHWQDPLVSSWNGYYKSLTSFLEGNHAPVITLEALPHLDRTIAAYAALDQAGDRFLLPTPYNNPRPFVGWKSLAHIIQQFVPKEVAVCGSLLEVRGDTYSACVGVAYTGLRNYFPQIKLERTLCNDLAVELEHRYRDSELNDLC